MHQSFVTTAPPSMEGWGKAGLKCGAIFHCPRSAEEMTVLTDARTGHWIRVFIISYIMHPFMKNA